ncbi:hypothetical protein QLX08_008782 [Tetragonisca angustula]|uniref:Uncharacterized protein n=1 Tax=Tetragonisca angustula TaxID=166442 RepID=A0AAW0ZJG2_9HYME
MIYPIRQMLLVSSIFEYLAAGQDEQQSRAELRHREYVLMDKPHQRSVKDAFNAANPSPETPARVFPSAALTPHKSSRQRTRVGYAYSRAPPVIASSGTSWWYTLSRTCI